MEDIKTHPIDSSAVADPTGERADILNTAPDQQSIIPGECD